MKIDISISYKFLLQLCIAASLVAVNIQALVNPQPGENLWHIEAAIGTELDTFVINKVGCCSHFNNILLPQLESIQNTILDQLLTVTNCPQKVSVDPCNAIQITKADTTISIPGIYCLANDIDARTRTHYRHTSTMIAYRGKRVMIDCGEDWLKKVWDIKPDAIVITHAHPDHAWGLKKGSPCPVYAAQESWDLMNKYPIDKSDRHLMVPYKKVKICGITFETFSVVHSILAPGVGYRITAGRKSIFCVHDLISIDQRHKALKNCKLYIGDGATIVRPMVRRKDDKIFGHTTIRAQLGWCQKEDVPKMIVTHCGSQIVEHARRASQKIKELAKERGIKVKVAHDGMMIEI